SASIRLHRNIVELCHDRAHRRRNCVTHDANPCAPVLVVSHPDKPELRSFEKKIQRVVKSFQTEVAIGLAAGEIVFIGPEKFAQHLKRVAHVRRPHFSTSNAHGPMMPQQIANLEFRIAKLLRSNPQSAIRNSRCYNPAYLSEI